MPYTFHVVNNDINLEADGLIGCDILENHGGKIDMKQRFIKLGNTRLPFEKSESLIINPRSKQIIHVNVDNDISEGIMPQLDIHPSIYCGNALVKNQNGKAYVMCINTSDEIIEFETPYVDLEEYYEEKPIAAEPTYTPESRKYYPDSNENKNAQLIEKQLNLEHLNDIEKESVRRLLREFSDIFFLEGQKLKAVTLIEHQISTVDDFPIRSKQFRHPPAAREEGEKLIKEQLRQGIIEPSNSPYSSPVLIIPKKLGLDGSKSWRIVIDYRKLNEKSVGDAYPLPLIADILDKIQEAKYITVIDLKSGFHQVKIAKKDRHKTAFTFNFGHYQYKRLPMGLKSSPATFQRLIDLVLAGIQGVEAFVYIDDILILAKTIEEHEERCRKLFLRLRNANMTIEPKKCEFMKEKAEYLGHIVGNGKIEPNPKKVKAIREYPVPKNQKKVKQFLGLASYYRKFIKGFARIAKPLHDLLKKDIDFVWGAEQQQAFEKLKEALCSEPVLVPPDFSQDFKVYSDASDFALGAILCQGDSKNERVIAYASRVLKGPELKYSTYEKELLALVFATEQFRAYLYGRPFKAFTDNMALRYLFNTKKPDLRAHRLKTKLEGFEIEICHKSGKSNMAADALSRNPVIPEGEENPELSRLEIYELADKQIQNDNQPENEKTHILITNTRRKRYRKDDSESEPENELQPPKSKFKIGNEETIISHPKFEKKLKNLIRADKMKNKILANSTPNSKPPIKLSEDIIQVPISRKVGRPRKIDKPEKKPLRKVGFDNKIQTYSSVSPSTSNSKFGLLPSSLEKTRIDSDSSSEDETKIKDISSRLEEHTSKLESEENPKIPKENCYNNSEKKIEETILLNETTQVPSILKEIQNFSSSLKKKHHNL